KTGLSLVLQHGEWKPAGQNKDASDKEPQLHRRHGQNERGIATGRKSWLFSDSTDGAKASAVIYSLMLTCRACGVEPLTWLRHVLTELPQRAGDADVDDLLPFNFTQTATA
ncbi:transposase domain-containing protein, partial [Sinorhizobium meliloti]|uniref:transposase domain-containing protein n=1 Tax=Rhizobium meliloti TaxID=382 RepID=UPI001F354511